MPHKIYEKISKEYNNTSFTNALELFQRQKYEEAIVAINKLIPSVKAEDNKVALALLFDFIGQCTKNIGNPFDSLKYFKLAIENDSNCSSAWHNMGLVYMEMTESSPVVEAIDRLAPMHTAFLYLSAAISTAKTNNEDISSYFFLHSMASFYEKYAEELKQVSPEEGMNSVNNYEKAIYYYQQAIEKCPSENAESKLYKINFSECLAQYGHLYYQSKLFDKANELYQETLKYNPNHLAANNQLGIIACNRGEYQQAISYFNVIKQVEKKPQEISDAWLNIACCHRKNHELKEAEKALNKAMDFADDPHDKWITAEQLLLDDAIEKNQTQERTINAP